jgi:hypothetical protein
MHSNKYPLHVLEAHFVVRLIVELRVERVEAWLAMAAAFSSVPPFLRYAMIPVARNVWLPILVAMPAQAARRRIIS